jgi:ribosome-associated translation inhibitor RaiA
MNVQISIRHMAVTQVYKHMLRDLCGEMQKKYGEIQNIDVKIEDITGPHKKSIDKRCHLKVRGKKHLAIDIDRVDEDLDSAIDNAFLHLKQALRRYHPGQIGRRLKDFRSDRCFDPGMEYMS